MEEVEREPWEGRRGGPLACTCFVALGNHHEDHAHRALIPTHQERIGAGVIPRSSIPVTSLELPGWNKETSSVRLHQRPGLCGCLGEKQPHECRRPCRPTHPSKMLRDESDAVTDVCSRYAACRQASLCASLERATARSIRTSGGFCDRAPGGSCRENQLAPIAEWFPLNKSAPCVVGVLLLYTTYNHVCRVVAAVHVAGGRPEDGSLKTRLLAPSVTRQT